MQIQQKFLFPGQMVENLPNIQCKPHIFDVVELIVPTTLNMQQCIHEDKTFTVTMSIARILIWIAVLDWIGIKYGRLVRFTLIFWIIVNCLYLLITVSIPINANN